ncbi:MAG: 2-C-methyl-D-erythritol 4-phosphate cytidylyltransferase [Blautia sp.]|uniref:2-C-methyl-D-erythritol 4-phosphate cytidylyltransferase n=1 Tax=unclassified Blautia TaxID=2648079 RepID=UPI001FD50676|nr:2-C-methyl-D-erythritol 4-phosphate cytidylyltransferase [Blautia sp. NSJ-175]MCJ7849434.1 2-C-methyl-D-erythritol 4-phosphate cytidylyltransferase [Blautia sp. NSJ-175]
MKSTAIVLAAGQGKRMNSKVQKQFLLIKGKPVLYYSLSCFQNSREIEEIIVVTGNDSINFCKQEIIEAYGFSKVKAVIAGGRERYDSVYAGLCACEDSDYVFIHDGARPFLTEDMIRRGKEAVLASGACVIGMPSKDTIKIADENGMVASTPSRSLVWNIQTPQIFSYTAIREAYERARQQNMADITDDAMVMERFGNMKIKLVEGSYENIKITTPEDILVAKKILEKIQKIY